MRILGLVVILGSLASNLNAQRNHAFAQVAIPQLPRPRLATERNAVQPDSVIVGYQQWKGALKGGIGGALLGSFLGLALVAEADCSDCVDEPSQRQGALFGGLVGLGVGGVLGFLNGLATPKYAPSP